MSEVALLLPNTDRLQQVADYVRGCATSTEYWPPSTGWRLCPRLHYFYRILIAFNKLKFMSEVVLLLANTDRSQQFEDYVRGALLLPNTDGFNKLKIISEVALFLPNTDLPQQFEDYVSGCTTSSEYWPNSTGWILCQRLHYFYRILTDLNQLKIMSEVVLLLANTDRPQKVEDYVRGCTTSSKYWPP